MLFANGPTSWNERCSSMMSPLRPAQALERLLEQERVVLHARTLAHHPAPDAQVLERAQQLLPAEPRLAQRLVPALTSWPVLDARDVDVEPVEGRAAEPGADRLERRGEVLGAIVPAAPAGVAMREVHAG